MKYTWMQVPQEMRVLEFTTFDEDGNIRKHRLRRELVIQKGVWIKSYNGMLFLGKPITEGGPVVPYMAGVCRDCVARR